VADEHVWTGDVARAQQCVQVADAGKPGDLGEDHGPSHAGVEETPDVGRVAHARDEDHRGTAAAAALEVELAATSGLDQAGEWSYAPSAESAASAAADWGEAGAAPRAVATARASAKLISRRGDEARVLTVLRSAGQNGTGLGEGLASEKPRRSSERCSVHHCTNSTSCLSCSPQVSVPCLRSHLDPMGALELAGFLG
jgi:hypothetical protein